MFFNLEVVKYLKDKPLFWEDSFFIKIILEYFITKTNCNTNWNTTKKQGGETKFSRGRLKLPLKAEFSKIVIARLVSFFQSVLPTPNMMLKMTFCIFIYR